jgi:hypothetical protein
VNPAELATAIGAALGAGAPVAFVTFRRLGDLAALVLRAVTALERIATELERIETVKLRAM